jgi:hypothetical protein
VGTSAGRSRLAPAGVIAAKEDCLEHRYFGTCKLRGVVGPSRHGRRLMEWSPRLFIYDKSGFTPDDSILEIQSFGEKRQKKLWSYMKK